MSTRAGVSAGARALRGRAGLAGAALWLSVVFSACAGGVAAPSVSDSMTTSSPSSSTSPAHLVARTAGGGQALVVGGAAPSSAAAGGPTSAALSRAMADARRVAAPPGARLEGVFPFAGGFAQQWRLANGLRLVLAPDAKARVLAYHTWVGAGSAMEQAGSTGVAHLLEHLMFKATATQPAGAFDRAMELFGASANATTWLDWTSFHEVIVPARLPQVAALEADRLHGIRFERAGVQAELEVVRNERRETVDDDPDAQLAEVLYHAAYGETPYGHPTIGWDRDLAGLDGAKARRFHRQHYRHDNVWLVLVGALDPGRVLPLIAQVYGPISGTPASETPANERPARGAGQAKPAKGAAARPGAVAATAKASALPSLSGQERVVQIDAEADRLLVGWRTVPVTHRDHAALTVLVEVLANAASARVTDALVHRDPIAAHVAAELPITRREGLLELHIELLPGKTAKQAAARLGVLLDAVRRDGAVHAAEVKAARNRLLTNRYAALASVDARAEGLGMFAAIVGDPAACPRWWAQVERVSAADVQRVVKTWLVPAHQVVVRGVAPAHASVTPLAMAERRR